MLDLDELMANLKIQIIEQLNLTDIKPADIGDDQSLFGDGLGLDSLDVLELIVLLKQKYKLKLANPEEGPAVFKSVKTMAEYINEHLPQKA